MTSAPPIAFEYRPSRRWQALVAVLALTAAGAAWLDGWPWPWRLLLCVACLAYAGIGLRALRRPPVRAVGWRTDGGWTVQTPEGNECEAVLKACHVLPGLLVLRLGWERRACTLALLPDNLDADTRRRLRMRLSASADTDPGRASLAADRRMGHSAAPLRSDP